jgi:hypothetical protein
LSEEEEAQLSYVIARPPTPESADFPEVPTSSVSGSAAGNWTQSPTNGMPTLGTVPESLEEDEADEQCPDTCDSFHETIYYVEPPPELVPTRELDAELEATGAAVPESLGIVLSESNSGNSGTLA